MNEKIPDSDSTIRLCKRISNAWDRAQIPRIDETLRCDLEFGEFYALVADRHWSGIDIDNRKFKGECWVSWLPPEARAYYLGCFLYYCVEHITHPEDLDDRVFFCLITQLAPSASLRSFLSAEQIQCVIQSVSIIRAHLAWYDCYSERAVRKLNEAEVLWRSRE